MVTASFGLSLRSKPRGIDEMISAVKTATDHEAIAARYDEEAVTAPAQVERHLEMAERCRKLGGSFVGKHHMGEHCVSLARIYERAAKENAALAEGDCEMAK